jgi:hypothetical protein
MRAFTVSETELRLDPVEQDPFIAPPVGDRARPPRPRPATGHPIVAGRPASIARSSN